MKLKYVVIGTPRSGSTWLAHALTILTKVKFHHDPLAFKTVVEVENECEGIVDTGLVYLPKTLASWRLAGVKITAIMADSSEECARSMEDAARREGFTGQMVTAMGNGAASTWMLARGFLSGAELVSYSKSEVLAMDEMLLSVFAAACEAREDPVLSLDELKHTVVTTRVRFSFDKDVCDYNRAAHG